MRAINFLVDFISGQANFFRVDHDHVIAARKMRRVRGLVLADQNARDARRQTPQRLIGCIDHDPIFADGKFFGFTAPRNIRAHQFRPPFSCKDKR